MLLLFRWYRTRQCSNVKVSAKSQHAQAWRPPHDVAHCSLCWTEGKHADVALSGKTCFPRHNLFFLFCFFAFCFLCLHCFFSLNPTCMIHFFHQHQCCCSLHSCCSAPKWTLQANVQLNFVDKCVSAQADAIEQWMQHLPVTLRFIFSMPDHTYLFLSFHKKNNFIQCQRLEHLNFHRCVLWQKMAWSSEAFLLYHYIPCRYLHNLATIETIPL